MADAPVSGWAPIIIETDNVATLRKLTQPWREAGERIAFVPTMGNLHAGHLSLVRLARRLADRVVMSIFVNPTQFGAGEDFNAYPRTLEADRRRLVAPANVDLLFVPTAAEVYPFGTEGALRFVLPPLSRALCGASRPGHFDGVVSVVCRLLNMVQPDVLLLGRKDYQQLVLVERMVKDLRLPVEVVGAPIKRAPDGLALSSRNGYLSVEERLLAPRLHEVLTDVAAELAAGALDIGGLQRTATERLARAGFQPDYVEVRRQGDLAKPTGAPQEALIVLGAAWLGHARLIDNVEV